jgi:peptidoglycan/LPS O-acetylase OafA/YrhL
MYFIIIEKESLRNISGKSIILFCALLFAQFGTGIQLFFPNYIIFGIGFLLLGLALSTFEFRLILNSTVIYIGKISFSMYLVHFAVLYWLDHFNLINFFSNGILNYCSRFFLVTFLTILISIILYKTIEVPFQEIGKRIIARLEKTTYSYNWFGKRRGSLLN